jgi:hypothetical protein
MSFSARTLQDAAAGGAGGLGAYLFPNGVYDSFAVGTTATTTWNARNTGEIQIIGISTDKLHMANGWRYECRLRDQVAHHLNDANYRRNRHLDKHVCW